MRNGHRAIPPPSPELGGRPFFLFLFILYSFSDPTHSAPHSEGSRDMGKADVTIQDRAGSQDAMLNAPVVFVPSIHRRGKNPRA